MWSTDSAWFDLAIILGVFAVGGILFGRFEQHKPRWRRVLKVVLVSAIYVSLAHYAGRAWAYGYLGLFAVAAVVVHAWWLPRHGIDGWTAEPYEQYLDLILRRKKRSSAAP